MTPDSIKKSFQATGVWPMDAEVILKRFNNTTTRAAEASKIGEHGDRNSWIQLRKVFDAAVADRAKVEAKQLAASLHSLQTQNELLHHENDGLRAALDIKTKHQKRATRWIYSSPSSITAARLSGVPGRYMKLASARPRNNMKPSNYNSRKLR
ncbi:hypothetical protein A1F99_136720 [Pyrenophora tritici-repentis]|nr:hypothetical protein A1F99_136720 [Pyrenophora tritici-repentis]KAI1563330.1 hypothetical protein PtrEW7m1_010629 [Pyrenophora tritici-repentis]